MANNNKVKNIILTVLVIGLVSMTVAYAALTQTLVINDNQVTVSTNWDVHFAAAAGHSTATSSSTSGSLTAIITQQLTLTATRIHGLRASFQKPGDKVEYYFDIVNAGGIDAVLTTASYDTPTCTSSDSGVSSNTLATFCQKINFSIVYTSNNQAPAVDDTIPYSPGSSNDNVKHCKMTVELDPNTDINDIPNGTITVSNLGATFVYTQD